MQKHIYRFVLMFAIVLASCSAHKVDEEVLMIYVRASMLYNEGRFKDTLAILDNTQYLDATKKFVPSLILRGKAKYFLGDLEGAETDLKRALHLRPTQTDAKFYLSRVLRDRGEKAQALALVEELVADNPFDVRTLRYASELMNDSADGGAASLAYLNRAVEAGSESALTFLERARRRWAAGRMEDAIADINSAKLLAQPETPLYRVIENLEKLVVNGEAKK